jgi:hypothetical protein
MRSQQKKVKFSKGQIDERLLERTDLDILDGSASEITNLVSTPYGGLKTRQGTSFITSTFKSYIPIVDASSDYGTASTIITRDTGFIIATGVPINGLIVQIDFESACTLDKIVFNAKCSAGTAKIYVFRTVTTDTLIDSIDVSTTSYQYIIDGLSVGAESLKFYSDTAINFDIRSVYVYGSSIINYSKLEDFIFNSDNEYLITLLDGNAQVYQNDVLLSEINQRFFLGENIADCIVAQQEDVMILTNKNMATMELTRNTINTYGEDWTTGANWAYASNTLSGTGATTEATIPIGFELKLGMSYKISFKVTNVTGGTFSLKLRVGVGGSTATFPTISANGTYEYYTSLPFGDIYDTIVFDGLTAFTGDISEVTFTVNESTISYTGNYSGTMEATSLVWNFGYFNFENIPKYNFNGDTVSAKTTTLTPDVTEGLVTIEESGAESGTTFTSASVGQYIDGGGGRVKITDYVSTTIVRGITIIPFYTTVAFSTWDYIAGYEDVWSATRGYPTSCLFYQQRLWFGGSLQRPNTFWGSRIDDYNNFKNIGNFDNDSIDVTISSQQVNNILNMYANRGIQVFTTSDEWFIPEGSLTPNTISISKMTSNGAKRGVRAVDISGTTLFIEKNGKSLISFVYNEGQNSFVTSHLSLLTNLIDNPVNIDIDYNSIQNEANYLYIVNSDGDLIVACILLDHKINSYVKFNTEGTFKDVCVLGSEVYVLVNRQGGYSLEKLVNEKGDMVKDYTPIATNRVYPATEYINKDIIIYDDDNFYGRYYIDALDATVYPYITLGSVPAGDVKVALGFEYSLTSNKIYIGNNTDNIEKRIAKSTVTTLNTPTLTFCNQTISQSDDIFEFYGVTSPARDIRFLINGNGENNLELLSVLLNLNYGDK